MADDFTPDNTGTNGRLDAGLAVGTLETAGDRDWFRVWLYGGHNYVFDERGTPSQVGTLSDAFLRLANSSGTVIASNDDDGIGYDSQIAVHVSTSGYYYAIAGSFSDSYTGTYAVQLTDLGAGAATNRFQPPVFGGVPSLPTFGASSDAGGWNSQDLYPRALGSVSGRDAADIIGFGAAGTYVSLNVGGNRFDHPIQAVAGFGTAQGWNSQNTYPRVIGDINGDGRADIAGFASNGVYVAEGQSNGTFSAPAFAYSGFGNNAAAGGWTSFNTYPREIADVNGGGRGDIVCFASNGVYVAEGQANGTFTSAIFALGGFGNDIAAGGWVSQDQYPRLVGDVNNDGRADIVAFASNGVYVAEGQANGTFSAPFLALSGAFNIANGWTSQSVTPRFVADVNGDGRADIVGFGFSDVSYALGQSNGTFSAPVTDLNHYGADPSAGGWTTQDLYPRLLGDISGDGRADIVGFGSSGVYVSPSHDFTSV